MLVPSLAHVSKTAQDGSDALIRWFLPAVKCGATLRALKTFHWYFADTPLPGGLLRFPANAV